MCVFLFNFSKGFLRVTEHCHSQKTRTDVPIFFTPTSRNLSEKIKESVSTSDTDNLWMLQHDEMSWLDKSRLQLVVKRKDISGYQAILYSR